MILVDDGSCPECRNCFTELAQRPDGTGVVTAGGGYSGLR